MNVHRHLHQRNQRVAWISYTAALASIVLFTSRATAQPDYPDEATVRGLVYVLYQSTYISDSSEYTKLAESFYFSNEQDRQCFLDRRPKRDPRLALFYNPIKLDNIAIAPRPNGLSKFAKPKAFIFIPRDLTKRPENKGYDTIVLEFVCIGEAWRIRYDPFIFTPTAEIFIEQQQTKLERLENAQGDELRTLVAQERDDVLHLIAANEYVRQRGDASMAADQLERVKQMAAELARMTPEQAKAIMIKDIQKNMGSLRKTLPKTP